MSDLTLLFCRYCNEILAEINYERTEEFILTPALRLQSIIMEKAWQQDLGSAGPLASTVRKGAQWGRMLSSRPAPDSVRFLAVTGRLGAASASVCAVSH